MALFNKGILCRRRRYEIKCTLEEAFRKPELVEKYSKWLSKNIDKLEEIKNIEPLEIGDGSLSDSDVEYLKERGWYRENKDVGACLTQMSKYDTKEMLSTLNQLIKLQSTPSIKHKYEEELKQNIIDRDNIPKEVLMRKRIKNWLFKQDDTVKIQSLF